MTSEEIKVKNWLNRAFYAEKKVRALDMLVRQCRTHAERLSRCGECNYTGKSDTVLNGTENAFMKLVDMEQKYSDKKAELLKISDEISEAIALLHDDELETVLVHRYLLFHTIEQTAQFMHYSSETVKRKQRKAIGKLTRYDLV
ncbi:MAG: hypothetical protein K2I06_14125 [Ruminococcus sp.]|nr:hypothetical protein [Ruminococcus sp.]